MLCTLRAVQHIQLLYLPEVFTAASDKVIFQTKKARRKVDLHDSVGLVGGTTAGGLLCLDGIRTSFKLRHALHSMRQ
jgi:hypothetical protein